MARPLNKKLIQERINTNKKGMKEDKKFITDALTAATKGEAVNPVETRAALASFLKSSKAFVIDTAKLASITE